MSITICIECARANNHAILFADKMFVCHGRDAKMVEFCVKYHECNQYYRDDNDVECLLFFFFLIRNNFHDAQIFCEFYIESFFFLHSIKYLTLTRRGLER